MQHPIKPIGNKEVAEGGSASSFSPLGGNRWDRRFGPRRLRLQDGGRDRGVCVV